MPVSIIQRVNRNHAANQAQAATRLVTTGNRVIDRINRDHSMASNEVATRIKIKPSQTSIGLGVFLDGKEVGRIIGARDPRGLYHSGYYLELKSGKRYGYNGAEAKKPGAYAYANDLKHAISGWIGKEIIEQFATSAN